MKKLTSVVLVTLVAFACAASLTAQDTKKKQKAPPLPGAGTGGNTPHATTSTVIGRNRNEGATIVVSYGRPTIKHPRTGEARKIWGSLVPWDKADRLGSDEAT